MSLSHSMTTHVTTAPVNAPRSDATGPRNPSTLELVLLAVGLLAMYVPTYVTLDRTIWKIVGQGHGPIMLALTMWLVWQRLPRFLAIESPRAIVAGTLSLLVGVLFYVVGRSQDILFLDVSSQIFILIAIALVYKGWSGLKLMWFPIFFVIFIIPIPGSVVDQVTAPLKAGVSYAAEHLLYMAGYPIGRTGVTLTIGQYQLLVADACAGLNSIFALEAIGVFYMSVVQHASKARNVMLAMLILPISFVSNVLRVIALVLVTYYFGDEAGQGFVHDFAGILLFMVATILTIGMDSFLGLFFKSPKESSEKKAAAA
jgi:exosortase B